MCFEDVDSFRIIQNRVPCRSVHWNLIKCEKFYDQLSDFQLLNGDILEADRPEFALAVLKG
jgi:hypothetical protein